MTCTLNAWLVSGALAVFVGLSFTVHSHADDNLKMTVYKTPTCGCCNAWVKAMQSAGYQVHVEDMKELSMIKRKAGVPKQLQACHTAVLGKYVIEGHVPLQALEKLHREQPQVRGIGVAGMPAGSLGMGYDPAAKYDVMSFTYSKIEKPVLFYQAGK